MHEQEKQEDVLNNLEKFLKENPRYKTYLNNLLGIESRDNAIFISVESNGRGNKYDLKRILSENGFQKIFSSNTFTVEIKDSQKALLLKDLTKAKDIEKFLKAYKKYDFDLKPTRIAALKNDFASEKAKIITSLSKENDKKILKWKHFQRNYLDRQTQTNSWPLYIGTMFLKVNIDHRVLFAPLIFKKVRIEITQGNKINLLSLDDSVEINEKLLFLIKNIYKINLPKFLENENYSFDQAIAFLEDSFKTLSAEKIDFKDFVEKQLKSDIKNSNLEFASGQFWQFFRLQEENYAINYLV